MNGQFKCRLLAGLMFGVTCAIWLSSCVTKSVVHLPLPATVPMNDGAGKGTPLIVILRLKSGVELPFEIDSGAFLTVIDSSFTNQFGRYRGKAIGGGFIGRPSEDMAIYEAPKLYLGDTQLRTSTLIVSKDLRVVSQRHPLKGILGMDCLRHYCIQLDFDRREIRFLDPEHLNVAELGKAFPLVMNEASLRGAQAYVDAALSGQGNVRFWVDTGYSGDGDLRLKPDQFQKLVDNHPPSRTGLDTSFGQRTWRVADLPSVDFGGIQYKNLQVAEMPTDLIKVPAWMSLHFLARHQVTFNFPKRVMYLKQFQPVESDTKP